MAVHRDFASGQICITRITFIFESIDFYMIPNSKILQTCTAVFEISYPIVQLCNALLPVIQMNTFYDTLIRWRHIHA
jgi:hypothetical protein